MKLLIDISQTCYEHQDNLITAVVTLILSAIVRYFEKKHLRDNERKKRAGQ